MKYKKVISLLLLGLIILAAMIIFVGPGSILTALERADKLFVALAIIIQIGVMFVWAIRWGIISTELRIHYNKVPFFLMLLVGLALNNITPSANGGGEPVRAYLLTKQSNIKFQRTFATVLGDKLLDTIPFMLLAIISMIYLMYSLHISQSMYISLISLLILFVLICVFVVYICINQDFGIRSVKWIFRQLNRFMSRDLSSYEIKTLDAIIEFQKSVRYLLSNRRILTIALPLSVFVWILEILRVYVVFLAFGVTVPIGIVTSVFIIATLIGMIPVLPGGIGAVDGMMILLYSMAGVSPSVSTAVTLIERLISYWMVSVLGLMALPYFGTNVLNEVDEQPNNFNK